MSKTRTFVAVDASDDLRRRAAGLITRLRPYAPQARWVDEEGLHLTMLFLGELSDPDLAETCSRVEWATRANEPFSIRVRGVGAFPDLARPRAVWLGVADGAEPLRRLQADLDDGLSDLAPRGENRDFVPHMTLARLGGRGGGGASPHFAEVLAGFADHDAGEMLVDEVTVFASELRRGGPEYQPLARCPLGIPGA